MSVSTETTTGPVTVGIVNPQPPLIERLDEMLAWWQPVLGLGHWRLSIDTMGSEAHRGQCQTDGDYPNAMIRVNEQIADNQWAAHDKLEELVVHELIHAATVTVRTIAWDMHKDLPKPRRKAAWRAWNHAWETMTETMARSIVAAAHADRSGEPPSIGGIVIAKETE